MPKVVSYTPPWLSRPSPGATLFSSAPSKITDAALANKPAYEGPTRTLARRESEVFIVVDNEIRWADLARLKNEWQQSRSKMGSEKKNSKDQEEYVHYRVG